MSAVSRNVLQFVHNLNDIVQQHIVETNKRHQHTQKQIRELTKHIAKLQQQNKVKDELLLVNSKVIKGKTDAMLKLKRDIDELKKCHQSKSLHKAKSPRKYERRSSSAASANEIGKKEPRKPLPAPPPIKMPFIHKKTNTNTSTLSEAAVDLLFPVASSPIMPPSLAASGSMPLQLSPICENKSRDEDSKKYGGRDLTFVKTSDDNCNITHEWGQSIASTDDLSLSHSETSDAGSSPHIDGLSYCSDNTVMLTDIHMSLVDEGMSYHENESAPAPGQHVNSHFTQMSNGFLHVAQCDVINSPVKLFSANEAFTMQVARAAGSKYSMC